MKDEDGELFTYWALTGLVEGENSDVLTFSEAVPMDGELRATDDSRVITWARRKSVGGPYFNLVTDPIDLSGLPAGDEEFELYIEAIGPVSAGSELGTIFVSSAIASAAGWLL